MPQSIPVANPDFAAFIAIDWADREHASALQVAGCMQRETGRLQHTPEAIEAWAMQWARRLQSRQTYDEALYLAARQIRAVPLPPPAPVAAASTRPPASGNHKSSQLSVGQILKSLLAEA
jgi:hypothetical protein